MQALLPSSIVLEQKTFGGFHGIDHDEFSRHMRNFDAIVYLNGCDVDHEVDMNKHFMESYASLTSKAHQKNKCVPTKFQMEALQDKCNLPLHLEKARVPLLK